MLIRVNSKMSDADDDYGFLEPKKVLYKDQEGAQAMVGAYARRRFNGHSEISRMFLFGDLADETFGYFLPSIDPISGWGNNGFSQKHNGHGSRIDLLIEVAGFDNLSLRFTEGQPFDVTEFKGMDLYLADAKEYTGVAPKFRRELRRVIKEKNLRRNFGSPGLHTMKIHLFDLQKHDPEIIELWNTHRQFKLKKLVQIYP